MCLFSRWKKEYIENYKYELEMLKLRKKVNKMLDNETKGESMELNEDDIIKFYELQSRYDPIAPNIAIVGKKERYKKFIKRYIEDFKKPTDKIYLNFENGVCRIISDDIEYNFIHIRDLHDLRGYKFRKFI